MRNSTVSSVFSFLSQWYSDMLLAHGDRVLGTAKSVFRNFGVDISGKVAGIHWHYWTHSHAAELTAGYYNTIYRDGYSPVAELFARHDAIMNFTCFEMRDSEQAHWAGCSPEHLLRQVVRAAKAYNVRISGENALPRYDTSAYQQVSHLANLRFSWLL